VHQQNEYHHEEEEPFEPKANPEILRDPLEDLVLLLEYLENPGELDQLVEPCESRNPCQGVEVLLTLQNKSKREDRQDINEKPTLQVASANLAPRFNDIKVDIIKGCVEDDDNV
jgi:hypothetical protein